MNKDSYIAFFDSGMGGLSVLKTAVELYPFENYLYYADVLNAPYGNYSKKKIFELTKTGISEILKHDVKAIVLACNTATNVGAAALRNELNIDILGLEPALKPAAAKITDGKILVLATNATVKQQKFKTLCQNYNVNNNLIISPQKHLARDIENNFFDKKNLSQKLDKYLKDYNNIISGCVLGCTHYVLIKDLIREKLKNTELFDGNTGVILNLFKTLRKKGLVSINKTGSVKLITTDKNQHKRHEYAKILNSFQLSVEII
ncbi:MAG: glutamate racemase [Firmicutes bacterium]|nr:glutamate racemase [Bacillota bacterium]